MPIENISDTARWIAAFRARESERPDALFRDPFARALAGERGEQIMRAMPGGHFVGWTMAVRTQLIDELVLERARAGCDLVLNLACGLDTRPYRLPLPAGLRWVEADLPGILDYKEGVLGGATPSCAFERVRVDLADESARRALFARLGEGARRALVITEGLLVYLPDEAVAGLARDLHAQPGFAHWTFDLVARPMLWGLKLAYNRDLAHGNARMQFGPWEGTRFFAQQGWREAAVRNFADEGLRLRRGLSPRLWGLARPFTPAPLANLVRGTGSVVLLERS